MPDPTLSFPPDHDFLRAYLRANDAPCPGCGYSLRGLSGDRCPECNQQLVLTVGLAEPKLASFFAALIGLAAGAGFGALMVCYALYSGFSRGRLNDKTFRDMAFICGSAVVVEGGLMLLLLWKQRQYRRFPVSARAACIALAWLLTITLLVVFAVNIR